MTVAAKLRAMLPSLAPRQVGRGETLVQTTIHKSGLALSLNQALLDLSHGRAGWNAVCGETKCARQLTERHATVAMKGKCWCVHVEAAGDEPEGDIILKLDSDIGAHGPECRVSVRTSANGQVFDLAHKLSSTMVKFWSK
jgi:hypothetical protein